VGDGGLSRENRIPRSTEGVNVVVRREERHLTAENAEDAEKNGEESSRMARMGE